MDCTKLADPTGKFWIDVGGTFTDVVAVRPDGETITCKLLSSGRLKGRAGEGSGSRRLIDCSRKGGPADLYAGYTLALLDASGRESARARVRLFDPDSGTFDLDGELPGLTAGANYELYSGEPAPVVAVRLLMGIPLGGEIGPIDVRLGTTWGTNALLERKGAPTALVTTRGFADLLKIGTQDRPALFKLRIEKPAALFSQVVELHERIGAGGEVLVPLERRHVKERLEPLIEKEIRSLAVCLLNSYRNHAHERLVAEVAAELGCEQVSISSEVSPTIKMVSRGDTTVVDAYLTPVIRRYIDQIQAKMPQARLRIMTSAGGLLRPGTFRGRDAILSGPAGGVVGFAAVAKMAGFARAIGFDMGGTSTDVSQFSGRYEYEFETKKAGVRVVAPMLAIETVAAGGGSICRFDGQKLVVGPESAGAEPGPACYGRGGPLAVTDINAYLGKIPPETFPFPLELDVVAARLEALSGQVHARTGKRLSPRELAEGFTRIANANMAAPIKRISIARGCDVREYVLVSFGGAGAQHACAVARMLGMRRVLLHAHAGVLSAYGMGLADVKGFREQTLLKPLTPDTLARLDEIFARMDRELRRQLAAEGVAAGQIRPPRRMLELRYLGQSAAIAVEEADLRGGAGVDAYVAAFERKHRQLYGHVQPGRALEVATARMELAASLYDEVRVKRPVEEVREAAPASHTTVVFAGQEYRAGVYFREALHPGHRIAGPAIVIEPTSTIVIEPGWEGQVTELNDLLLTDTSSAPHTPRPMAHATRADPIQLELFNNQFASIAEQMGTTLQRTALSTNVKERLDFSCAVFTAAGELVANAPHIPVHLGAMSECVKQLIEDLPDLAPGDVLVTNDPLRGGSHLPDITVVTPVHDHDGQLLFFTGSRAHHAEIGGKRPGSMPPDSTRLSEEGVLIRRFKVVDRSVSRESELRRLLTAPPYPSRSPDENLADIRAQIAANQAGAQDLLAMIERYGRDVVLAYMDHIRRAAENKMRAAIGRLPDGRHAFRDRLDDGSPIAVTITVDGERALIDFAGTGPVMQGNLNANRAIVSSAVLYCLRCLIDEDIPLNSGVLAPVEIRVPEGLLDPPAADDPADCAAVAGGNVETSQRVVDVIFGALGVCAASQGTMNNLLFGDDTFGYYETICGGAGAGADFDGADAVHTHMTNTRLTDPEVLEARYPVRLVRFAIRKGSGGAGARRGGDGVVREIEFLKDLDVSIVSTRRTTRPYGLAGGQPGASGRNLLRRKGSHKEQEMPWLAQFTVRAGDVVTILTPGGGGYGPSSRHPAAGTL